MSTKRSTTGAARTCTTAGGNGCRTLAAANKTFAKAEKDAILIKNLREAGILPKTAQIHLTPKEINVDELSFDDGQYERYYGREGAVYVDIGTNSIRTAYGKAEFDDSLKNLVKEMERNGLLGERGV